MISDLEFHHAGVACRNLEREIQTFSAIGYEAEGAVFEDPAQGIRGLFMRAGGHRVELVAPLDDTSRVLANILSAGMKLYHFAYITPDIERSLAAASLARAKLMVAPVAAVAFGGQRIAFVFMPNMLLIELIELSTLASTSDSVA
jgi:methylmalonyl-CoA/ethylmalonyl-CoA epimerase